MATSFNHWGKITDALPDVLSQVVRKTAFDAQGQIQGVIRANGQIATGFMLNSVYVVTSEESTYGQAGSPPGDSYLLPVAEKPPDKLTAFIGVGANYGLFQNYGTRFMPARPFFEPGIEATRPGFEAALAAIDGTLKAVIG